MMATIALVLICLAAALQAAFLLRKGGRQDPVSHWLLAAGGGLLVATIVQRSIAIRFVAVTNTYESLVFFSAAIALLLFVLRLALNRGGARSTGLPPFVAFGATLVAAVLLMISSSPVAPKEIAPPIPALQSLWLVLHVTFSFIGEAFFVVSFVAAIAYLGASSALGASRAHGASRALASGSEQKRADMDRLAATSIGIGYPIFTAGALIFGAIWAETAWGSWWSWDPKETWALVTWLIYTAYLHTRLVRSLRGRVSAILAIAGFAATIFTFFGVNFLLSGLHSYG
jgi:cytochrome c-type biogenesis protein CcsB